MTISLVHEVFGHLCHQDPSRAWQFGGVPLVLCARCTGVYAGAALAASALPFARFDPSRGTLWLFGAFLIQMAVLGFNPFLEPAWIRTLSGSLFSAGAVYFLWLPLRVLCFPQGRGATRTLLIAVALAALLLQLLVRIDVWPMASAIELLSLLGVLVFALLILGDIAVAVFSLVSGRHV